MPTALLRTNRRSVPWRVGGPVPRAGIVAKRNAVSAKDRMMPGIFGRL
jgi:hypothetical protein